MCLQAAHQTGYYRRINARKARAGIWITQGEYFEVFAPQGRLVAPMGMTFGIKFHPIGAQVGA